MPPKGKGKGKGKSRTCEEPSASPQPVESPHSESSGTTEQRKRKLDEKQYAWTDEHQSILAEFWLNHPLYYDKTQQHYKNGELKKHLIEEMIEHNKDQWNPKPTVGQVETHLRNTRTRFGKLLKKKSGDPATKLSYTDQKLLDRYQFLRQHLQRNRTTATHNFRGTDHPGAGNAYDEGHDDDDDSARGSEQPATSEGKKSRRQIVSSASPESEDTLELEIMKQAKHLVSAIRTPSLSAHETRVRDFCRYMESEIIRVPESAFDECSFQLITTVRGFSSAGQQHTYQQCFPGVNALQQPQTHHQPGAVYQQAHPMQPVFQQPQMLQTSEVSLTQLSTVASSALNTTLDLNTSLGLDNSFSSLLQTSTPCAKP